MNIFFLLLLIIIFSLFEWVGWFSALKEGGSRLLVPIYDLDNYLIKQIKIPYDFLIFSFSKFKYMGQLESRKNRY